MDDSTSATVELRCPKCNRLICRIGGNCDMETRCHRCGATFSAVITAARISYTESDEVKHVHNVAYKIISE